MNRKTILIYSQSDLAKDPRVHRQIELLAGRYHVIAFGNAAPAVPEAEFVDLTPSTSLYRKIQGSLQAQIASMREHGIRKIAKTVIRVILKKFPEFPVLIEFWETWIIRRKVLRQVKATKCDLIIANDSNALPVCASASIGRPLLYDAHEYTPGQYPKVRKHRAHRIYSRYLLRRFLPRCDMVSTVGEGLAHLYHRMFGVNPVVVTNAPDYRELAPVCNTDGKIRLVHHGIASPKRELETMIDVMGLLDDRFTLDFYLMSPNVEYYEELKAYAAKDRRIRFNPPVPMTSLPEVLNVYDIGFWLYRPTTLNLAHALPNKFFEFVQARLAVAVGPTPEMARYIHRYGFGLVSVDFTPASMAAALSKLDEKKIMEFKTRAHACARELSSEPNREKILAMVEALIGR